MSEELKPLSGFCNPTHPDCPLTAENKRLKDNLGMSEDNAHELQQCFDELLPENEKMVDLLYKAASQLRFIGCFANCDKGVTKNNDGSISKCQCCVEQEQIETFLLLHEVKQGTKK